MSYALGQPVPLAILIKTPDGQAEDATTVTLTVTKPDGTEDQFTGGDFTHPGPGDFRLPYVPLARGLYGVRWVETGSNASAPPLDSFYVNPPDRPSLVSLREARRQLSRSATTDDDQLADLIQVASKEAEDWTGKVWRRTALVDTFDGSHQAYLQLQRPVIAVTSVVEDGVTLDPATDYVLDGQHGWLSRAPRGRCWSAWSNQNITVDYVAGPVDGLVDEDVRLGVLLMVQHLCEPLRGPAGAPRRGVDTEWVPGLAFSIPRRVQELWGERLLVAG